MAVRIKFDNEHNAIQPTLVLARRSGHKLGNVPACNIKFKDGMNECSEMSFDVNKADCVINGDNSFWKLLVDFKLIWVREWDRWFEIYVEIDVADDTVKHISAKALGESELSQINLYDIEINTEDDIAREDYEPTVLYDKDNPNASLLTRIMDKAPHYNINHVDFSIANIQRTFTFDGKSIYAAFNEIAEEIECLFVLDCHSDSNGNIVREVNVYDLKTYCLECGERGSFEKVCDKCGSTNVKHGYGEDTTIFVSTENLADNIKFTTDNGSVKNCFKLKAGDDLMTSTIANCNPNGSGYIWYISDEVKEDMSEELVNKIDNYNNFYEYYQNYHSINIPSKMLESYNELITKYNADKQGYKEIQNPITGYPALMETYYNVVDFYLYLNDILMPSIAIQSTSASKQIANLKSSLTSVAVKDIKSCSNATAESSVLAMAKVIVDNRYKIKIADSTYEANTSGENGTWEGTIIITSYYDENDASSSEFSCEINGNYEEYVKQKIDKALKKSITNDEITDVVTLFNLPLDGGESETKPNFKDELTKYSLSYLKSFYNSCQSCIDVLIEQGIANKETWADKNPNLYAELYEPYLKKLDTIKDEMSERESDIEIITGVRNSDGDITSSGVQTFIESERNQIQELLNFENYIGEQLWLEFVAYRREDTYSNDNYISDGLDNSELFKTALEFIEVAKEDIFKSATLQHSISAALKNLLVIKDFEPIVEYFEVGNWIRVRVDENIYRLRILDYEIDFENLDNISITFSDVVIVANGVSDVGSVLSKASDMSTSYGSVSRQAKKGNDSKNELNNWVEKGMELTKMKIVDNADNQNISWDNHGFLCKEYSPITDNYDDKQLKIINRGLYLTDDGWTTSKAGIGDFTYFDPKDRTMKEAYGVIANTLVGNLILSKEVGIYNESNNITLDENGLTITSNTESGGNNESLLLIKKDNGDKIMHIDENGNLVLNGSISINTSGNPTLDDISDPNRYDDKINDAVSSLSGKIDELDKFKAESNQYMTFDANTGLTIGANPDGSESAFKIVITNEQISFKYNNNSMAYINSEQLHIPNAVIENKLTVGKFLFDKREDGGFSISWKG